MPNEDNRVLSVPQAARILYATREPTPCTVVNSRNQSRSAASTKP